MTPLTRAEVLAWPATGPMALKAERVLALLDERDRLKAQHEALYDALDNATDQLDTFENEGAAVADLRGLLDVLWENAPPTARTPDADQVVP